MVYLFAMPASANIKTLRNVLSAVEVGGKQVLYVTH